MPTQRPRPGRTVKLSISLDARDVRALKRIARESYGGNLSAAIAGGVRRLREEEGRQALLAWLGGAAKLTPEDHEDIRREWAGEPPRRRRRRRAA